MGGAYVRLFFRTAIGGQGVSVLDVVSMTLESDEVALEILSFVNPGLDLG